MRKASTALIAIVLGLMMEGWLHQTSARAEDDPRAWRDAVFKGPEAPIFEFMRQLALTSPEEFITRIEAEQGADPLKAASQMDWVGQGYEDMANQYGEDDPAVARAYRAKAEVMYKRGLALREALGANHPEVAISLGHLAMLYWDVKPAEEKAVMQRLLSFKAEDLPPNGELAWMLRNLASWYQDKDRPAEVEALRRDALAVLEKMYQSTPPPKFPEMARSDLLVAVLDLAEVYKAEKRYAEAIALYQRFEHITGQSAGQRYVMHDMDVAELHQLLGQSAEAEQLYLKALAEAQEQQYAHRPEVAAQAFARVAAFYRKIGKPQEAQAIEARAKATAPVSVPGPK